MSEPSNHPGETRDPKAASGAAAPPVSQPAPAGKKSLLQRARQHLIPLVVGLVLVFLVGVYALYRSQYPSTEDAYLYANYVWISPRVFGEVSELLVAPNQYVKAGTQLFQIDPRPYEATLREARAKLVEAEHYNASSQAQVQAVAAEVKEQEAILADAKDKRDRLIPLVRKGVLDELDGVQIEAAYLEARAALVKSQSSYTSAEEQLGSPEVQQARIEAAQAEVEQAALNLEFTKIVAPADGWVTQMRLRVGDVISPGDQLFPFIEDGDWWVQANFKETDMGRMKPGMPATIAIDMYGGQEFRGVVESISFGSAASFSLLPPQNTTGNWVKVTQRIPVRIRLLEINREKPPRFGASVTAQVDLDGKPLPIPTAGQNSKALEVGPPPGNPKAGAAGTPNPGS